jgi:hypothetical protein
MARIPSPIHAKSVPKRVSKPTETAEAAATVAESAVAPARKRAAAKPKAAKAGKAVAAPVAVEAPAKPAKAHKPKLVRDSFTMPKDEYQVIDALKRRALGLQKQVRKSELLRAGIQALSAMNDRTFLKAIADVPTLKTGRPKAD